MKALAYKPTAFNFSLIYYTTTCHFSKMQKHVQKLSAKKEPIVDDNEHHGQQEKP